MLSRTHVHQIPITKSQIPNNIQSPNSNYQEILSFFGKFGHYLVIGAWDLVLHCLYPRLPFNLPFFIKPS